MAPKKPVSKGKSDDGGEKGNKEKKGSSAGAAVKVHLLTYLYFLKLSLPILNH